MTERQRTHLTEVFGAALERVDPYKMLLQCVSLENKTLRIETEETHTSVDLAAFSRVIVLGAGKAGAPMARALEEILGDRISGGVVSVKAGQTLPLDRVTLVEAGHPVPNAGSTRAGALLLEEARAGDSRTLFLNVISGGGSALVELPREAKIGGRRVAVSLDDLQRATSLLLASGADIHAINTIRKHLSAVKGGNLAAALAPAHTISLILSDVVGDDLDAIASGLTVPDSTTFADALGIVDAFALRDRLPDSVMQMLTAGAEGVVPETPKAGDPLFKHVQNVLIGTNYQALVAAAARAEVLGYRPVTLTSQLEGEARGAAGFLGSIIREARVHGEPVAAPCCLLAGGETTVTVTGDGRGGRNQELALAMLIAMADHPELYRNVAFLSGATDGADGPTDAAGGFASPALARKAGDQGLDLADYLARNDSYHLHEALGSLFQTGATNTNVCDIQIALIEKQ